jgi:hypothetical protein
MADRSRTRVCAAAGITCSRDSGFPAPMAACKIDREQKTFFSNNQAVISWIVNTALDTLFGNTVSTNAPARRNVNLILHCRKYIIKICTIDSLLT